jgi:hypothetical protein
MLEKEGRPEPAARPGHPSLQNRGSHGSTCEESEPPEILRCSPVVDGLNDERRALSALVANLRPRWRNPRRRPGRASLGRVGGHVPMHRQLLRPSDAARRRAADSSGNSLCSSCRVSRRRRRRGGGRCASRSTALRTHARIGGESPGRMQTSLLLSLIEVDEFAVRLQRQRTGMWPPCEVVDYPAPQCGDCSPATTRRGRLRGFWRRFSRRRSACGEAMTAS